MESKTRRGILERLDAGEVVVGDGGYVMQLERVKAGHWTPEAAVEHPEAVRQLHREFLRAGANVIQTFTFYGVRINWRSVAMSRASREPEVKAIFKKQMDDFMKKNIDFFIVEV
ncbi:hypothetical protein NQZ68_003717 [Dissostichus eleginoides]|nr:hypothetical protein NQZ68_003717 [Dissostichus eleginoides]